MEKRPFWWGIFHPNLTGGLIVIIIFLLISAIGNVFTFYSAITGLNLQESMQAALAAALYAVPGIGLMRLKKWARMFEIAFSLMLVALGAVILFSYSVGAGVFIIVTHGLVAAYLLSKRCRRVFYPEIDAA